MAVGLAVSLLGHWTWLVILIVFLIVGSLATKWRFEEKQALSIQEANEGVRSWRNVTANGATASIIAFCSWYFGEADWYYLATASCVAVAASDTLASENNPANLLERQGELAEAEEIHQGTLEARRRGLGAGHPATLGSANNLANALAQQGRVAEAARVHRETLEARRRIRGPSTLKRWHRLKT